MTYLKPKNIYGKTYWYVVESRRVNGQIKTVNLAYLGKADDILSLMATTLDAKGLP